MGVGVVQHSFSGHETFPFRYPWLKKGFDAVREDGERSREALKDVLDKVAIPL